MDKQDLRYLLQCDKLPVYDISKLTVIWDNILKEYENLTNSSGYSAMLRKINWDTQKVNRLNGLIACFYMLKYKQPGVDEALSYWHITNNSPANLMTTILREKTKLNIEVLRNQKKESKPDFDFDKMVVSVENSLERNLDIDSISVKKWVYLCKSIEERVKQLESLKNGRSGQNNSR